MDLHHNPIDYVSSQLSDFNLNSMGTASSLSRSGTPLTGAPSLNRTSSLMDSLGIQRTQSPFVSNDQQPSLQQSRVMSWTQSSNSNFGLVGNSQSVSQDTFHFGSNMGTPSLSQASISMAVGPPGMNYGQPPQSLPTRGIQILWHYLDQANNIQGPFASELMDQWYNNGFFNEALQIMALRSNDPFRFSDRFITFRELLERTGAVNPFHCFDIICSNYHSENNSSQNLSMPLNTTSSHLDFKNGINPQPVHPTLLSNPPINSQVYSQPTESQPLEPQYLNFEQKFSEKSCQTFQGQAVVTKGIESPDFNHAEILKLTSPDGSYYHETTVTIPASKHIQTVDTFAQIEGKVNTVPTLIQNASRGQYSVDVEYNSAGQNPRNAEFDSRKSVEGGFQDIGNQTNLESAKTNGEESLLPKSVPPESISTNAKTSKPKSLSPEEIAKQLLQEEEDEKKKKNEKIQKKQGPHPIKEMDRTRRTNGPNKHGIENPERTSDEAKEKQSAWGNKPENSVPTVSLIEMQKRQAEEKKRKDMEREKQEREAALKLQQALLLEEEKKKNNSISNIASWAAGTTQKASSLKTVEESRKEALEAKKFIEEQKRILEEIEKGSKAQQKIASSGQSTLSASKGNISGWTTVLKKKAAQPDNHKPSAQPSSYVSPDRLRSVSANSNGTKAKLLQGTAISIPSLKKPNQSQSHGYMGNETTSAQQSFLNWCRSQMKLSVGVKIDSVLEMLLSLPANMESREIIADTIYANSTLMDGKSFASEFIKRRIECEETLFNPLPWSEVLNMPQGNADDWEFQVVGKKKGKRY